MPEPGPSFDVQNLAKAYAQGETGTIWGSFGDLFRQLATGLPDPMDGQGQRFIDLIVGQFFGYLLAPGAGLDRREILALLPSLPTICDLTAI